METDIIYKVESYAILGKCMEVHNILGHGFLEIVYKDALEYEFRESGICYSRESKFEIPYKKTILGHLYYADFTVYDKIILEVKSMEGLNDSLIARSINYLKVSQYKLALLVNFGKHKLEYRRIVF